MKLFSAPYFSLFSRKFYSEAAYAGASRGFLYLVYLSMLMLFVAFAAVNTRLLPQANTFVEWLQSEMPVMQWMNSMPTIL